MQNNRHRDLRSLKESVARLSAPDFTELLQFMLTLNIYEPTGARNQIKSGAEWFYLDPHQEVQGPFSTECITAWFHKGFFTLDLLVSPQVDGRWVKLKQVFPHLVVKQDSSSSRKKDASPNKREPTKKKEEPRNHKKEPIRSPVQKPPLSSARQVEDIDQASSRKRREKPEKTERKVSPRKSGQFNDLGLDQIIVRALDDEGYKNPTPVQSGAIPLLLQGRDVFGIAQTGSGKTCAFLTPVLQFLHQTRNKRKGRPKILSLILSPTRELAAQIDERVQAYSKYMRRYVKHTVIFGGVNQNPQTKMLNQGVHILTACPGRLLDLVNQGFVDLSHVEFFVLDEADRMLDMGFIHDIKKVLKLLPDQPKPQNLLFSATMPETIVQLGSKFLNNPARVDIVKNKGEAPKIIQRVMFVSSKDKPKLLTHIMKTQEINCAIVFTRTKHGANRLARHLSNRGINATAIHGNKSQNARTQALAEFKDGSKSVLVATDVASRGIDVDGVSHVFNFDLPNEEESYVHRIGRTARAGKSGVATAFCSENEGPYLKAIQKLTKKKMDVVTDHPFHLEGVDLDYAENPPHKKQRGNQQGRKNDRPRRDNNNRRNDRDDRQNSRQSGNERRQQGGRGGRNGGRQESRQFKGPMQQIVRHLNGDSNRGGRGSGRGRGRNQQSRRGDNRRSRK